MQQEAFFRLWLCYAFEIGLTSLQLVMKGLNPTSMKSFPDGEFVVEGLVLSGHSLLIPPLSDQTFGL